MSLWASVLSTSGDLAFQVAATLAWNDLQLSAQDTAQCYVGNIASIVQFAKAQHCSHVPSFLQLTDIWKCL